jgi:hypothetical protein
MHFNATRHSQKPFRRLAVLLLAIASTAAAAQGLPSFDTGTAPLREIAGVGGAFVRGAPLPAWADLLVLTSAREPAAREALHKPSATLLARAWVRGEDSVHEAS